MSSASQRTTQESFGTLWARQLVGVGELDARLQDQLAEFESLKWFPTTVWRDEPDPPGCNWNPRLERIKGTESSDLSWWNVVPQMRGRFKLL
jgi:hypothetical protein